MKSEKTVLVELNETLAKFLTSTADQLDQILASGETLSDLGSTKLMLDQATVDHFRALRKAISNPFYPSVVIGIEGGWPQGATANTPIDVVVVDYGRDAGDEDRARELNVLVDPEELDVILVEEGVSDEQVTHALPRTRQE